MLLARSQSQGGQLQQQQQPRITTPRSTQSTSGGGSTLQQLSGAGTAAPPGAATGAEEQPQPRPSSLAGSVSSQVGGRSIKARFMRRKSSSSLGAGSAGGSAGSSQLASPLASPPASRRMSALGLQPQEGGAVVGLSGSGGGGPEAAAGLVTSYEALGILAEGEEGATAGFAEPEWHVEEVLAGHEQEQKQEAEALFIVEDDEYQAQVDAEGAEAPGEPGQHSEGDEGEGSLPDELQGLVVASTEGQHEEEQGYAEGEEGHGLYEVQVEGHAEEQPWLVEGEEEEGQEEQGGLPWLEEDEGERESQQAAEEAAPAAAPARANLLNQTMARRQPGQSRSAGGVQTAAVAALPAVAQRSEWAGHTRRHTAAGVPAATSTTPAQEPFPLDMLLPQPAFAAAPAPRWGSQGPSHGGSPSGGGAAQAVQAEVEGWAEGGEGGASGQESDGSPAARMLQAAQPSKQRWRRSTSSAGGTSSLSFPSARPTQEGEEEVESREEAQGPVGLVMEEEGAEEQQQGAPLPHAVVRPLPQYTTVLARATASVLPPAQPEAQAPLELIRPDPIELYEPLDTIESGGSEGEGEGEQGPQGRFARPGMQQLQEGDDGEEEQVGAPFGAQQPAAMLAAAVQQQHAVTRSVPLGHALVLGASDDEDSEEDDPRLQLQASLHHAPHQYQQHAMMGGGSGWHAPLPQSTAADVVLVQQPVVAQHHHHAQQHPQGGMLLVSPLRPPSPPSPSMQGGQVQGLGSLGMMGYHGAMQGQGGGSAAAAAVESGASAGAASVSALVSTLRSSLQRSGGPAAAAAVAAHQQQQQQQQSSTLPSQAAAAHAQAQARAAAVMRSRGAQVAGTLDASLSDDGFSSFAADD